MTYVEPDGAMNLLHPDQKIVMRLRALIWAIFPVAALAILDMSLHADLGFPRFVLPFVAAVALALTAWLLPARRYRHWRFAVGEDELAVAHGALMRTWTAVPFGRVQHIDVAQGPIERRYGLARLVLHTAGTRSSAVTLPGLPIEEAERIRDAIRARIRLEDE